MLASAVTVLAVSAGTTALAQDTPDLQVAEQVVRGLFDDWMQILGATESVTYSGPWTVRPVDTTVEFVIPDMEVSFSDTFSVTLSPQTVVYRPTGPGRYELAWPEQDSIQTMTFAGFATSARVVGQDYVMEMVEGELLPRTFTGVLASMDTEGEYMGMANTVTMGATTFRTSALPSTDGRVSFSMEWEIDDYVTGSPFLNSTTDRNVGLLAIKDLDTEAIGRFMTAYMALIDIVAVDPMEPPPEMTMETLGEVFTLLPDLADYMRMENTVTGMTLQGPMLNVALDSVTFNSTLSDISDRRANGDFEVAFGGVSTGTPSIDTLLPRTVEISGGFTDLPFAEIMDFASEQVALEAAGRLPDDPAVIADMMTEAGSRFALTDLLVDYPGFSVQASGSLLVDSAAVLGMTAMFDLWLNDPDGLNGFLQSHPETAEAAPLLEAILFPLADPDGDDRLHWRLTADAAGQTLVNGRDASVLGGLFP